MYEVVANSYVCEFEREIDAIHALVIAVGMINPARDYMNLVADIKRSLSGLQGLYEYNASLSIRKVY